ncbi:family 16 glycosylhydrolase [Sulfurovum sp. CS9]|uniref:glycoside hydrolase family 16 protein n=1 Tax=Sulfurovum sp. CS9 TaxID=3391146 RepID=UPI0039EAB671
MFKIVITFTSIVIVSLLASPAVKTGQTLSYDQNNNIVTDGSVKDGSGNIYAEGITDSNDGDISNGNNGFTDTLLTAGSIDADKWKLVWSDEFNYEGLPDKSKWTCEEGFIRNEEKQYYTRDRKENARVENGTLIIEARKEKFENPIYDENSTDWRESREYAEYTSASLITENKASWKYGRIEVRAKLPQGLGIWPAIWTLGTSCSEVGWPECGEIDIMEYIGRMPDTIYTTVAYVLSGGMVRERGNHVTDNPFADFHIYAMEWYPDRIDFFFDKIKYYSFQVENAGEGEDNPFRKPHYLLINFALGGKWTGEIDNSIFPQKYIIDYVRIYEQKTCQ